MKISFIQISSVVILQVKRSKLYSFYIKNDGVTWWFNNNRFQIIKTLAQFCLKGIYTSKYFFSLYKTVNNHFSPFSTVNTLFYFVLYSLIFIQGYGFVEFTGRRFYY